MTAIGTFLAQAINARGQVVGAAGGHALFWDNGVMTDLGTLPGDSFSVTTGVNARGRVVGYSASGSPAFGQPQTDHAVLWETH